MSDADYEARLTSTGRNDSCPCGSGKKYKKCHLDEDQAKRSAALKALEAEAKARAAEKAEEEEGDTATADKSKPTTKRQKDGAGLKSQTGDAKPKNMPRRSAV
jgi:hypothetical protein